MDTEEGKVGNGGAAGDSCDAEVRRAKKPDHVELPCSSCGRLGTLNLKTGAFRCPCGHARDSCNATVHRATKLCRLTFPDVPGVEVLVFSRDGRYLARRSDTRAVLDLGGMADHDIDTAPVAAWLRGEKRPEP